MGRGAFLHRLGSTFPDATAGRMAAKERTRCLPWRTSSEDVSWINYPPSVGTFNVIDSGSTTARDFAENKRLVVFSRPDSAVRPRDEAAQDEDETKPFHTAHAHLGVQLPLDEPSRLRVRLTTKSLGKPDDHLGLILHLDANLWLTAGVKVVRPTSPASDPALDAVLVSTLHARRRHPETGEYFFTESVQEQAWPALEWGAFSNADDSILEFRALSSKTALRLDGGLLPSGGEPSARRVRLHEWSKSALYEQGEEAVFEGGCFAAGANAAEFVGVYLDDRLAEDGGG